MKLVIFDCDGTLVDSQNAILSAMEHAFTALGLAVPERGKVLGVIGLSLPEAFAVLAPRQSARVQAELAQLYRADFPRVRPEAVAHDPLFSGVGAAVEALARRNDVVLGIATGKSRRGVARLLDREGWQEHFFTIQTADDHPSKPHPSMILRAMAETGVASAATIMVGDTTFDMEMARNAGVGAVGVAWGYHPPEHLVHAGAHAVAETCEALVATVDRQLAAQEGGR
ncbi:MAG: HAD-IA family hydrolase [Hyphomicrobiaceae bacterium]|nr:MAG: HAD-IA family hydrolase [Hyphomicrobiaceae bacterium]